MTFRAAICRVALSLLAATMLIGCVDSSQSQLDEERESNYLLGTSRVKAMDYAGAIESFEKALEVNPKSGAAHLALACVYESRQLDPAAAIYHYQQYLKLRPNAANVDVINQHVFSMKQELVQSVSLGPVAERQQKEFERLVQENKRLSDEVEKWRAYAVRLQALTNPPASAAESPASPQHSTAERSARSSGTSSDSPGGSRSALPVAASPRTHTVQAGETLSTIARKYGVKLQSLLEANPRLDPRRMRVGQTLILPASL